MSPANVNKMTLGLFSKMEVICGAAGRVVASKACDCQFESLSSPPQFFEYCFLKIFDINRGRIWYSSEKNAVMFSEVNDVRLQMIHPALKIKQSHIFHFYFRVLNDSNVMLMSLFPSKTGSSFKNGPFPASLSLFSYFQHS